MRDARVPLLRPLHAPPYSTLASATVVSDAGQIPLTTITATIFACQLECILRSCTLQLLVSSNYHRPLLSGGSAIRNLTERYAVLR